MTRRHRLRRRARGFTLVELMISLVMGLIVALAAVSLARTATDSFHEQARLSVTEMGARMGAERLRQDLMRASYMSTGNIKLDPKVGAAANAGLPRAARIDAIDGLRGIRLNVPAPTISSVSMDNGLAPDVLDLVGNFTTDEAYSGTITKDDGICSGSKQAVTLDPLLDDAVKALSLGALGFGVNAAAAFNPGDLGLVQVTDANGCKHYATVCDASVASGLLKVSLGGAPTDGDYPVFYAHGGTNFGTVNHAGGCGTSEPGPVTIAPLSWIRWQLVPSTTLADPNLEGPKSDITRTVCKWSGYKTGTCVGDPEIVAEYAVGLKFGVTAVNPNGSLTVYDVDNPAAAPLTADTTHTGIANAQSVRSVRYRIATRAALPDRDQDLPSGSAPFLTRYKVTTATGVKYARVRTIVSEVALMNQASMGYF